MRRVTPEVADVCGSRNDAALVDGRVPSPGVLGRRCPPGPGVGADIGEETPAVRDNPLLVAGVVVGPARSGHEGLAGLLEGGHRPVSGIDGDSARIAGDLPGPQGVGQTLCFGEVVQA